MIFPNVTRHILRLWFYLSPGLYAIDSCLASVALPIIGDCSSESVRDAVRAYRDVIYNMKHRTGSRWRRWPGLVDLLAASGTSSSAARAELRQGPVMADSLRQIDELSMDTSTPVAIDVRKLGVRYSLRFTRKTTLRKSFTNLLTRNTGEQSFWALREVDFRLVNGESLAIIGPNGAGKSTLLQVLAGIITPSEGVVDVRGHISSLLTLGPASTRSSPAART